MMAGRNPASETPRKKRTARRPEALWTRDTSVQITPQITARRGMYHFGLSFLRRMLLGVS